MTEVRKRDAAATRTAILRAARRHFAQQGYEQVGVRKIAAEAGVNEALVSRYFGSKEGLFREVLNAEMENANLLHGDPKELGVSLARMLFSKRDQKSEHEFLILLLRSASYEPVRKMIEEALDGHVIRLIAEHLGGPHARLRAGLLISGIMGLALQLELLNSRSLYDADPELFESYAGAMFQRLIDG